PSGRPVRFAALWHRIPHRGPGQKTLQSSDLWASPWKQHFYEMLSPLRTPRRPQPFRGIPAGSSQTHPTRKSTRIAKQRFYFFLGKHASEQMTLDLIACRLPDCVHLLLCFDALCCDTQAKVVS